MFFEVHEEKKIGYKKLSAADLGVSKTGNQTHIGLSESVLTFISDRDEISEDSIFIYKNHFEYIDAYLDRIKNPDGSFRSPKIRIGGRGCVSIVSAIRTIVKDEDVSLEWYLVWFGLKNSKIVFLLFNNRSEDYTFFSDIGINLERNGAKVINDENQKFSILINYIEKKVNKNGEYILKELEIITQVENARPNKQYGTYDIEKANERNKKTGREGEVLVDKYLSERVKKGQILCYNWYNRESESGYPYDFSIEDKLNNIIYLDVKTTGFNFEQQMVFSSQEIKYIAETPNPYCIYRVYKNENGNYLLRVCEDCKNLSIEINNLTSLYSNKLKQIKVNFKSSSLAIAPNLDVLTFGSEIEIEI